MQFINGGLRSDTVLSGMNTYEGVASISHPISGDLLFYTNGVNIWDEDHSPMPNGIGLSGHRSSTQSAAILRVPGSKYLYYVFTIDDGPAMVGARGLRYSIVDMRLNVGKGDVVLGKRDVLIRAPAAEQMTITKHGNLNAYWLITSGFLTNQYFAYLVTSTGVSNPIISSGGPINRSTSNPSVCIMGQMKVNVQGNKMAIAHNETGNVTLFDFNNVTGRLSKPLTNKMRLPYGVEFSPNGKYLYVSDNDKLIQFRITPSFPSSRGFIVDSRLSNIYGALQLGKDQRIYVSPMFKSFISAIRNPNVGGVGCGFDYNNHSFPKLMFSHVGLPNLINSGITPNLFFVNKNCVNQFAKFSLKNSVFIDSVSWNFGDPSSGISNYSTNKTDSHKYSAIGKYAITAILYTQYKGVSYVDTLKDSIKIIDVPQVNLGNDTAFCRGPIFVVNGGKDGVDFLWSDGRTTEKNWLNKTGQYWVKVSNVCGISSDSLNLRIDDTLKNLLPNDTSFCSSDTFNLKVNSAISTIKWNTGDTTPSIRIKTSGKYWAVASNTCNQTSDTINVTRIKFPINQFSKDTVLCIGDTLLLGSSSDATSYLWNTGDTTPSIRIFSTGHYTVTAKNKCGYDHDSMYVYFDYLPQYPIRDTILCDGDSYKASVEIPYSTSYKWSTGDTSKSIIIKEPGLYQITITNVCGTGIEKFNVNQRLAPDFTKIEKVALCGNQSSLVNLNANKNWLPYTQIKWSNGSSDTVSEISTNGPFWVETKNICGVYSDTFQIIENTLPLFTEDDKFEICPENVIVDFSDLNPNVYWKLDEDSSLTKEFDEIGNYEIWYKDSNGCENETILAITRCSTPFYAPSAFTPNYDGLNEGYRVYKEGISNFNLIIINRWGQTVFQSNNIEEQWYGVSENGDNHPVGTYIYKASYFDLGDHKQKSHSGEVNLIR